MVRVINVGAENVGKGEFKLIPTGTKLRVAVYEIEEGKTGPNSKYPGEPQINYTAKVTEDGEFKGREIRYNRVPLHGKGGDAWKLATFADAVGWETDDDGNVMVPDNVTDALGTEFIARIGQQTSQKVNPETGQPYINNTVTGTLPLSKARPKDQPAEKPVSWDNT